MSFVAHNYLPGARTFTYPALILLWNNNFISNICLYLHLDFSSVLIYFKLCSSQSDGIFLFLRYYDTLSQITGCQVQYHVTVIDSFISYYFN